MQGEKSQFLWNPICVPTGARNMASGRLLSAKSFSHCVPYIVCFFSLLVRGQKNSTTYFKIYARKHIEICRGTELASPEIQLSSFPDLEVNDKLYV